MSRPDVVTFDDREQDDAETVTYLSYDLVSPWPTLRADFDAAVASGYPAGADLTFPRER